MWAPTRLLLFAALPTLVGVGGEVVSVTERAGPGFPARQRLQLVAAAGQHATLDCRVAHLADKTVSWVRSRDLQILTHAGAVFTADSRVSAAESAATGGASGGASGGAGVTRHSLRIERLRLSDSGRYECQVNTEPKMSLFFNLTVLDEPVPEVEVTAAGGEVVRGAARGAATLACEARYSPPPRALPLPPLDIRWQRDGAAPLSLQSSRGGVSLETERWAARVVSRLTLADLRPQDAARYTCSAAGRAASIQLLVEPEERMEMQRDQAGSGAGDASRRVGCGGLLPALLAALLPALPLLAATCCCH